MKNVDNETRFYLKLWGHNTSSYIFQNAFIGISTAGDLLAQEV